MPEDFYAAALSAVVSEQEVREVAGSRGWRVLSVEARGMEDVTPFLSPADWDHHASPRARMEEMCVWVKEAVHSSPVWSSRRSSVSVSEGAEARTARRYSHPLTRRTPSMYVYVYVYVYG